MRLVVVLPLRRLEVGEAFALRDWPLHVTVAPTFVLDGPARDAGSDDGCMLDSAVLDSAVLEMVSAAIEGPLVECPSLRLLAAGDEGFGRSGAIPVTVVEPSVELDALHHLLVAALSDLGARFDDPEFTGSGYRAHVTVRQGRRVDTGDVLEPTQAVIVDMEPQGDARLRRVVWARDLGAASQF
ncbi:hypothetical protein ABIB25_003053 [Nakamurella sp. UYEF19]|uniref:2'-5' RNA ligase family protein n=1 Tax=Nakamurella sp. UYEF19 TaxID=1756392 RepID=UPI00339103E7